MFRGALAEMSRYVPQIKIFFIREDFFRMHTGHTMTKENLLLRKDAYCHQNDIIIHGWKELGSHYWPEETTAKSMHDYKQASYPSCDIDKFRQGDGGNALCRWLSHEAELEIVRKHCYWASPLCMNESADLTQNSNRTDRDDLNFKMNHNMCLRDEHRGGFCWDRERINLMRWSLCLQHQVCDPYLSIAAIRGKYMPLYQLSAPPSW
jgi:hypothetical protein